MRVFVTGASGFIGSAVVAELGRAGHEVVGLARSAAVAERLTRTGVTPWPGELADLETLRAGAAAADGVVHLAFEHDFSRYRQAGDTDRAAVEALGRGLAGTDRPLVITSGTGVLTPGRIGTERDAADPHSAAAPRVLGERAALALADRGVRTSVVRLPPSVHSRQKKGFVATMVDIARATGVSGYVGDGSNRWPAVHLLDAAALFRLALDQAPAGSVLHGVAEEGIAVRDLAELIGRRLAVPTASIAPRDSAEHFGWLSFIVGSDIPASSRLTRDQLGWCPTRPGLWDDVATGAYFDDVAVA